MAVQRKGGEQRKMNSSIESIKKDTSTVSLGREAYTAYEGEFIKIPVA